MSKRIAILGATGSVGGSTLSLVEGDAAFEVVSVTAGSDVEGLATIARRVGAKRAVIADGALLDELRAALHGSDCEAMAGEDALCDVARDADLVMAAIVGTAGLKPVMAAIEAGVTVGLANKESLVTAGALMMVSVLGRLGRDRLAEISPDLAAYLDRGTARPAWPWAFAAQRAD